MPTEVGCVGLMAQERSSAVNRHNAVTSGKKTPDECRKRRSTAALLRKQVIREALRVEGVSKDKDVEELSLSKRKLLEVMDLSRFQYLKQLWLNGNKIRHVNFLHSNFRLCELHLHDNHLSDISGSLRHLTCLEVLTLHNNYLTDLARTVKEFDRMQALRVLNLCNNPLAFEPEYRDVVINSIPSLTSLDGSGTPANNYLKNNPPFENLEEAVQARQMTKSLNVYSMLDWSTVPKSEDRRRSDGHFGLPSFITYVFR